MFAFKLLVKIACPPLKYAPILSTCTASSEMAFHPRLPKPPQHQTEDLLCGSADCVSCRVRNLELRNRQRQYNRDPFLAQPWRRPWECDSCQWYFRRGGWREDHPHWVLHDSFLDLESSATMGCRSCRLFRQAIVYHSPTSADLWTLRLQRRPVWVRRWPKIDMLKIEYGRWPDREVTVDLVKKTTGSYFMLFPNLSTLADDFCSTRSA